MADFTSDYDSILKDVPTGLLLGGEFRPASNGETFGVVNPATDNPLVQVAPTAEGDAKQALDDAVAAQKEQKATPPRKRSEILYRASKLIRRDADELVQLRSLETGRVLPDSKAEVGYGDEFFRWFAEEVVRISGDCRVSPGGSSHVAVTKQPVGPVLAITPWNFPPAMGTRKIAPALAASYPVIIKPASKTSLTTLYLGKLLIGAGVPASMISVLPTGHPASISDLLSDDRLRKPTFTGPTGVGQMLAAEAAETSMRVSLELDGNAPFVILSDGDINRTTQAVNDTRLRNGDQVCTAPNRFIIHESKRDTFVEGVIKRFAELKLGEGADPAADLGSLALRDQREKVRDLADDTIKHSAKIEYGGRIPDLGGAPSDDYFFEPTVLTDMPGDADTVREKTFGPMIAVTTFTNDDRAIEQASNTIFGLAAYVFSENLAKTLNMAEALESDMVVVNKGSLSDPSAPFGGVKQFGLEREGSFTDIDEFLEEKLISLEDQPGEQLARGLAQVAASHAQQR